MDLKLLIGPIVTVIVSYLVNIGIDIPKEELEASLNTLVALLAGLVAHIIATRKAKKTP